ncbi:hypothetical protein RhiJN_18047 [Ceratobasidium sp. AG-Ba]|nr:hypothetical protein RhiJN_18047 [Ceratobasidium sp. AG-Ba]
MFKRINKKIRKKEQEVEDPSHVLGADTDSDESDSGSSSNGSANSSEDEAGQLGKRKRGDVSENSDEAGDEDEDERDEAPPMTVAEALVDPLYPTHGEAKACVVCPGKELKHAKMASVHVASSTHLRRMKRFATLATRIKNDDEDPRLLVAALDESVQIIPKNTEPASL